MKAYKRNSAVFRIIVILLILCDIASLAVLFSRINSYTAVQFQNVIPLTESGGATEVAVTDRKSILAENTANKSDTNDTNDTAASDRQTAQLANPSFEAEDDSTVWQSQTDVEIFHITYDSENGTTVKTSDGDKQIAPGTANEYSFTLKNTGDVALEYQMTMQAYVTGTDLQIPVSVRLKDYTGKYIVGDETDTADLYELNSVDEESKLSAGRYAVYTLEWEWLYESGNDSYDTMLGNLAVDDDLALTIEINTYASYVNSYNPDSEEDTGSYPADYNNSDNSDNSSNSKLADSSEPQQEYGLSDGTENPNTGYLVGIIPIAVTAVMIILLFAKPKKDKEEENQ